MANTTDPVLGSTDQLLEEIQWLRHLDALKNEFVARVAHDLRSPMASISGAAQTLLSSGDLLREEDRRSLLEMIARSTVRLSGLVDDVLLVARIEGGELPYQADPFDLVALAQRTAVEVEVGNDRRGCITVTAVPGMPLALADEERVWQVLTNLLSNALKFSAAETPVEVAVTRLADDLQVAISDRGIGVAADDLPRLFQKFGRIEHPEADRWTKGTGLGLYICRRIVEGQGGRIWAESRPGEGSTFSFTVPAVAA